MPLCIGTPDGLYRAPAEGVDDAERVHDCGRVTVVDAFPAAEGVFAAADDGLYRSTDGGVTWTDLGVPEGDVVSVRASPDGAYLYAGTRPPHVYVSEDALDGGGEPTWERHEAFSRLPGREDWFQLADMSAGLAGTQVRSLATHPDAPARLVAGVEAIGVYVSEDYGATWERRSRGLHDDVHHVLSLGADSYVASCGRGLYRTDDAGGTWLRLDTDAGLFWHSYFREAASHRGVLYAAAQDRSEARHADRERGVVLASTDRGETVATETLPGETGTFAVEGAYDRFVQAWTVLDDRVLAGTRSGRVFARRDDGEWEARGRVPETIRSLAPA